MTNTCCGCRCSCIAAAAVISAVAGVLAAFFQITGMIAVAPVFLWVVFGISVAYLGILTAVTLVPGGCDRRQCLCERVNAVLMGILGAIVVALVLLAFGIIATSVVSAILVGLLVFFFSLTVTATACLIRCVLGCSAGV